MRFSNLIMPLLCAWVLWGTPYDKTAAGKVVGQDNAVNGFESRAECMKALALSVAGITPDDQFRWQLACLPDTIDPRAPKVGK